MAFSLPGRTPRHQSSLDAAGKNKSRRSRRQPLQIEAMEDRLLMAVSIIDDGDPGFSTGGAGWVPFSGQGFQNDVTYHGASSINEFAQWTFSGLTPGTYRVSATWTPNANRATNAPYTIYNGAASAATVLSTVTVNQELAPVGGTFSGATFQDLVASAVITGTTLTVRLASNANEFVIADAIRIERIS